MKKTLSYKHVDVQIEIQQLRPGQNFIVLRFVGKFMSDNVAPITEELKKVYQDNNLDTVVDLSELSYANSTGLSLLLTLWKMVKGAGKNVIYYDLHPFIEDLFALTELKSKFVIRDNFDSAREALTEPA